MSGSTRAASTARTGPVRVRPATLHDIPILVRNRRGMFTAMKAKGTPAQYDQADRDYARWLRPRLKSGVFHGFIAEVDGHPAASGCVWLQERQPRPGFRGGGAPYLMSMFTDPAFRGRGLAKRIVLAATKWCRAKGYRKFTLHASPMGRPIYEKLGWKRTWEMEIRL